MSVRTHVQDLPGFVTLMTGVVGTAAIHYSMRYHSLPNTAPLVLGGGVVLLLSLVEGVRLLGGRAQAPNLLSASYFAGTALGYTALGLYTIARSCFATLTCVALPYDSLFGFLCLACMSLGALAWHAPLVQGD